MFGVEFGLWRPFPAPALHQLVYLAHTGHAPRHGASCPQNDEEPWLGLRGVARRHGTMLLDMWRRGAAMADSSFNPKQTSVHLTAASCADNPPGASLIDSLSLLIHMITTNRLLQRETLGQ